MSAIQKIETFIDQMIFRGKARIAKETGVNVSGKLYSDALGNAPADTYIGMYRHNIKAMSEAMKK